jgi:chromosome segregation ATPase
MSITKKLRTDSISEAEGMSKFSDSAIAELKEVIEAEIRGVNKNVDEMKHGIRRLEDSQIRVEDGLKGLKIAVESVKDDTNTLKEKVGILDERSTGMAKLLDEKASNINENIKKLERIDEKKTISTGKIKERLITAAILSAFGTLATVLAIALKVFFPDFPSFN